ncbi:MAG: tRNA 2-thiouridine(34) synthase MnmA, partial [Syntrophomonadaceae bacterium]|nr:tRNA 2-thiouridine(34) synthase MnmA [Syntrophomonadaceae bacterium]
MSGGVDSSVAALLIKQKGYQVFGITMNVLPGEEVDENVNLTVRDARKVSEQLGIPHYVTDLRQQFSQYVIDGFCDDYLRGRTPNPCIVCNQHIKFGFLLRAALNLGADFLATGHYARIREDNGEFFMFSGLDSSKDQSYFLYSLSQEQLAHTMFPLGNLHKEQVRELAIASGLSVAHKTESQEICFISQGRYVEFVEKCRPDAPKTGRFRFTDGKVLDMHHGVHRYTIGQRKGLGVAFGEPIFVTRIDPETATVWLGRSEELFSSSLVADEVRYISGRPFPEPR